jgi:hypothetical protein
MSTDGLFGMWKDTAAYDPATQRKTRPMRHTRKPGGKLACGHEPLPTDGKYVQYPLSMAAHLATIDCPGCRKWLQEVAARRVVARAGVDGVSNTPSNEGEETAGQVSR